MHRLRFLRTIKGFSQEELAQCVGVEQSRISKIERGTLKPSPELQKKIDQALGLPGEEGGDE